MHAQSDRILSQLTTVREAYPEKKSQKASVVASRGPPGGGGGRLNVALARLVDLKAALLAETSARGPDRSAQRPPQSIRNLAEGLF